MKIPQLNHIGFLFKTTITKWYNRDPFRESAIIAYSAIFSLPGILVLVITLTGYFFGDDAVSGHLHHQVAGAMGNGTADQVQEIIIMAGKSKDSAWTTAISLIIVIIGATGVFVEMQKSLNIIWEVKANLTKSGFLSFLRTRIFSFGLILSVAFLLLISLALSSLLSALGSWVQHQWSSSLLMLFQVLNFIFSLVVITVLFAMMFKILPDARIKWDSVWIGAFVTSLLFVLGKSALGLYIGKTDPGLGYGAAGSVILILLWTSYSSMIVFLGAEFTKVYSDHRHGETLPTLNAVKREVPIK